MKKGLSIIKKLMISITALIAVGMATLVIAGFWPEKNTVTPAGYKQHMSTYITMEDGVKIAARIMLPSDLQEGEKVPAIMECTRYGTKNKPSFLLNALINLGIGKEVPSAFYETLNKSKYAAVKIDARGSGASFGSREMEWSKEEINDLGQVIDWIAQQAWSNGKVGAYGISYSGNTAELAAVANNEHLLAVAPLYSDFDPMSHSAMPGGIFNEVLIKQWSESNMDMDANQKDMFNGGIAPVDEDRGGKMLDQALAERNNIDIYQALKKATFFDDTLAEGYQVSSLAPYNYRAEIEESGVPFYVRVGWHDAGTVNGAIERFLTYSNDHTLVIGPWNHGGNHFFDPFVKNVTTTAEIIGERKKHEQAQADALIKFFDSCLKESADSNKAGKEIKYYTLGEGKWKSTDSWPVAGFESKTFYFSANNSLQQNKPDDSEGQDNYQVDFTASTGISNRWFTNIGGGRIAYPDRSVENLKLLTYTSEPLENDVEITGTPVVTVNLSANINDVALFVYLEDVAPDGQVTYITEGQLRSLHSNETTDDLGRVILGPKYSFQKKDAQYLIPNHTKEVKIGMYATSVLLKKNHRIRVAIAGHDAANFRNIYNIESNVIIDLQRNSIRSSFIELPMKELIK